MSRHVCKCGSPCACSMGANYHDVPCAECEFQDLKARRLEWANRIEEVIEDLHRTVRTGEGKIILQQDAEKLRALVEEIKK